MTISKVPVHERAWKRMGKIDDLAPHTDVIANFVVSNAGGNALGRLASAKPRSRRASHIFVFQCCRFLDNASLAKKWAP
jgi:hypothetical protein